MQPHATQKVDLQMSKFRRYFIFTIGAIDCMLFGGAVFGWPQLVYTLKTEGIYADLCDTHHTRNITDSSSSNSFMPTELICPENSLTTGNQVCYVHLNIYGHEKNIFG